MNSKRFVRRLSAFLLGSALSATISGTHAQEETLDCGPVIANFRENVESAPSHVLTLLEDALIANGGHCVPDFVKTAIESSNADAKLVKKIVFVAVTNAQSQAPQIAEAAVAAAPKHADAVREAFADAFSDNNPRLAATEPADTPAWEQRNAPVPEPKVQPAPRPQPEPPAEPAPKPIAPTPAPAPVQSQSGGPALAANDAGNPYMSVDDEDEGWKLLHDGVVEGMPPIDPQNLRETSPEAPAAVEPPLPDMEKKKRFAFSLPSLPTLPSLPEVEEPVDLFFHGPFGGVPPVD
ncbi:MAG: hypothetical protein KDN19_14500 [Verrucomicrobiae bacterium]|nr:hypothetical protein [Verrucomicrobiae bacterium]